MEKVYDLCITGGGTAGCAAAYIASNLGLKTALVEKNNYLGGLMTGGLVIPVMKTDSENINTEFYCALTNKAKDFGAQVTYFDSNDGWYNPEILKTVLDDMLINSGVDIYFEFSPVKVNHDENKINSVEFSSNLLSLHIDSKYFLDSTGDSKIFQLAGENFFENNKKKQPSSLRFVMENVDINKLKNFLEEIDSNRDVTNFADINGTVHLTTACTWDDKGWQLAPLFNQAVKDGVLLPFDTAYFQIFTVAGARGEIAFNCPRLRNYNEFDPLDYSCALIEARQAILRLAKFVKTYFKGFENAYISKIADMTGKRETNKISAKKQFTADEIGAVMPQNPILCGDYPVDVHSNSKNNSTLSYCGKYYLTIDSLKSAAFDNLYAAGRNLGADNMAQAALRTQKNCMSMGEAVSKHIFSLLKNIN